MFYVEKSSCRNVDLRKITVFTGAFTGKTSFETLRPEFLQKISLYFKLGQLGLLIKLPQVPKIQFTLPECVLYIY